MGGGAFLMIPERLIKYLGNYSFKQYKRWKREYFLNLTQSRLGLRFLHPLRDTLVFFPVLDTKYKYVKIASRIETALREVYFSFCERDK